MSNWLWLKGQPKPLRPKKLIQEHLGIDLAQAHIVTHEIKLVQQVSIQRVLDRWLAKTKPTAQAFGYCSRNTVLEFSTGDLIKDLMANLVIEAPLERKRFDSGPGQTLDCIQRGLFLLRRGSDPVALAFRPPGFLGDKPILEVIAPTREAAGSVLSALLEEAKRDSVYKGQFLTIDMSDPLRREVSLRFLEVQPATREDIVLPDDLIQAVERNIFGMVRHADTLRAAGRSLKRGLLFHGPPGTGKTMMVRYLAQACRDHTVIQVPSLQPGLVREACQIARLLAPGIVVIEDVDLAAEQREHNYNPHLLHEMMDEMDGLKSREAITFLLTTNRPEILEPALCSRPGRIDLAIAFPLPDAACRRRLFEVYGRGLDLSAVETGRWVSQTKGVSPAFIAELLRKAALLAAERGETSQPLHLTDDDIQDAMQELLYFGGELTKKLMGYRFGPTGKPTGPAS